MGIYAQPDLKRINLKERLRPGQFRLRMVDAAPVERLVPLQVKRGPCDHRKRSEARRNSARRLLCTKR